MTAEARVFAGRYRAERELARGGMGRVLAVRDLRLGRELALKVMLTGGDPTARLRFVEEAQVTGQLDHPSIIPIHELGQDGEELYLVMPLVRGRTLKEVALQAARAGRAGGPAAQALRRTLRLFLKVCEAIAYAHSRGVIHRDLKPANVMVGSGDRVVVMDWGLARPVNGASDAPGDGLAARIQSLARSHAVSVSGDLTLEGAVVGTPAYMPPEQADGKPVDQRADVYSLGAILYELLTGSPPYAGAEGALQILTALFQGPPVPPRQAAPGRDIPPALESIVLRAMAREPERRYPDAAALAGDVEAFLDGRGVTAHREAALEALGRVVRLHRKAVAATALGLVALVVAGGVARSITAEQRARAEGRREEAKVAAAEAEDVLRTAELAERQASARAALAIGEVVPAQRMVTELEYRSVAFVGTEQLVARHAATLERLRPLEAALARLDAGSAPGPGGADPLRRQVEGLRSRSAVALARGLLAATPERLLELLDQGSLRADLGPAAPLVQARALARLGRDDDALAALAAGAAAWPRASFEALAARALELRLRWVDPVSPAADALGAQEEALLAAIRAVEAAVGPDASTAWLHRLLAEVRLGRGDAAGAREAYERAALLEPLDLWLALSRLAHLTPLHACEQQVRSEIGMAILQGRPGKDPLVSPPAALSSVSWGGGHYLPEVTGDIGGAIADWRQTGALTEAEAGGWLARMHLVRRKADEAAAAAREALAGAPHDRVALGCLALALAYDDQLEEAEAVARRGLGRYPGDDRLEYALGEALLRAGRPGEAAPHLRAGAAPCLESDRWLRLAQCLLASDDPRDLEEGIAAAREALSRDHWATFAAAVRDGARPRPGDRALHGTLGDLHRRQGELGRAALHYARAMSLQLRARTATWPTGGAPDLRDALPLAEVHAEMGLRAEAAYLLRWALELRIRNGSGQVVGWAEAHPESAAAGRRLLAQLEGG